MSQGLNFASDNAVGASPRVAAALAAASGGAAAGYGADAWTRRVEHLFGELFGREVAVFLVGTGTAANALALASVVQPWGAVITHEESHIVQDECGAPEFFSAGARLIGLAGAGAKLDPHSVAAALSLWRGESFHRVAPQALSITQATECGMVYGPEEVAALKHAVSERGLVLHMDGARFANAVESLGCTPAAVTWQAGVDILSFGGTKNGAWAAEAVIFFDPAMAQEMKWRRKRAGQTFSKGRFLAAQFEALLVGGHWLELAHHANTLARRLAEAAVQSGSARLAWPCQANEVFLILPEATRRALDAAHVVYHGWPGSSLSAGTALDEGESIGRFVMSFATDPADVDRLIACLRSA